MQLNSQTPEKRVISDGAVLSVHSIFYTIQGEGPFCGTPAVFLRLAGCNLQCPLCDTDYTSGRRNMGVEEIALEVCKCYPTRSINGFAMPKLVVITGGEPFRQNLQKLLIKLIGRGFFVQIETNGTFPPSECLWYEKDISRRQGVYIVCSPKAGKINKNLEEHICAFKYVMAWDDVIDNGDGLPLHPLDHPSKPYVARPTFFTRVPIYLQPTDHQDALLNSKSIQKCVEMCMRHGYILQLQTHKILGLA